jgi:hypothetical protein
MSLNKNLSFSSLYFVSSEYSLVKLINSRLYSNDLIDWFTDESDETNDRDETKKEYSWDRNRDETNDEDETSDEYSVDRL